MRGTSRAAAVAGEHRLATVLSDGADPDTMADELFAAAALIDRNASLRHALADPSRDGHAKRDLVTGLFTGKVAAAAVDVLGELAAQRWAAERDLPDAVEQLAVDAVLTSAERARDVTRVEDELFRFERIVAGNAELRDMLTNRHGDPQGKASVVVELLSGNVAPQTLLLARQSVLVPRGRQLEQTIGEYLQRAAARREQITAVVTTTTALTADQGRRLRAALAKIYGRDVLLQVVVDPDVMGGIRVRVGDEVVDGTIARRLDEARRHMAGG